MADNQAVFKAPDPRFFETAPPLSLVDAARLGSAAIVHADNDPQDVGHVAPIACAGSGAVVFAETAKTFTLARSAQPALVLTTERLAQQATETFPHSAIAVSGSPKASFAAIGRALHVSRLTMMAEHSGIAPDAVIGKSATIAPSAIIHAGATIGANAVISAFVVIGPGVVIGAGTFVSSHCSVTHAIVGEGCVFSTGVKIGEAGFGYVPGDQGAMPIPQLGRVIIGDCVDIGANSTVDRGALDDTIIGDGTKLDNLVQIAHNCQIGRHVLIASQTGVSGSCLIGDGVMIGGQAGMADHLNIGAGAVVAAKSGLMKDIPPGEKWGGIPAKPAREWMKDVAMISRLSKKDKK